MDACSVDDGDVAGGGDTGGGEVACVIVSDVLEVAELPNWSVAVTFSV
jgi:hypothetical protein